MKKLSIAKAADQYIAAKKQLRILEASADEAAGSLKEWFRNHPDKRDYKGRIGFAVITRHQLDSAKVKAELGKRLDQFQRVITIEQLSILE